MSDRKDAALPATQIIESGRNLISMLRENGVEMNAAFLIKNALGEWRLNIVSPNVIADGPRMLLRTIAANLKSLNGSSTLELYDVDVISPQNPDMIALLQVIPHGRENRVSNSVFDGQIIDDLHIFFSEPESIPALSG